VKLLNKLLNNILGFFSDKKNEPVSFLEQTQDNETQETSHDSLYSMISQNDLGDLATPDIIAPTKKPKKEKKKSQFRTIFIRYAALATIFLTVGFSMGMYELYNLYTSQETLSKVKIVKNLKPVDNTIIYDNKGEIITEKYSSYHKFTPVNEIPQAFKDAIISIEDRRFYEHSGIDLKAIARAAIEVISTGRPKQGGSTITQQLVRHYLLTRTKTIFRKIYEIILSIKLETQLSKDEILELYLNNLFLGNGSYGIGSAAERFFGKQLKDLETNEIAIIAGMFQAPSRYNPFKNPKLAIKRQRQVLRAMVENGKLSFAEAKKELRKKVKLKKFDNNTDSHNSYYADYITTVAKDILGVTSLKNKGFRIYTALDKSLNDKTYEAINTMTTMYKEIEFKNALSKKKNKMEAAAVVLDVKTGQIVSMIGGRNYKESNFNRAFQARRAPGSSFKPIVYSLALNQGYKWSDVFYVAPVTLAGHYRPRTEESEYLSESTLLRALYKSMNATTMEVGEKLGLTSIIEHAKKFGISSPIKREFGSLLGQSEVSLLDMVKVYSTFANNGNTIEPEAILRIEDRNGKIVYRAKSVKERETRTLSPQINFLMVQALRKVLTHGTARRARSISTIAGGKTGTTNNSVDNWFCGFTKNHVAIVWTGPNKPQALTRGNIQGSTLALPIWKDIISHTISESKPKMFSRPKGVTAMRVHPQYGHKSTQGMEMWFLSGSLPKKKSSSLEVLDKKGGMMRGFGVH
jgi:penicillin-binding protein 1A